MEKSFRHISKSTTRLKTMYLLLLIASIPIMI